MQYIKYHVFDYARSICATADVVGFRIFKKAAKMEEIFKYVKPSKGFMNVAVELYMCCFNVNFVKFLTGTFHILPPLATPLIICYHLLISSSCAA